MVPAEELEAISLKEEEKKNKQFGGGLLGSFSSLMFTSCWMTEISWQIMVALTKKGISKIKQIMQDREK